MVDSLGPLAAALADRYTIEGEAGSGGMAVVYRALDRRHGRLVALKVLRPDIAASMGPERFIREIEIAARLQHPHILPVFDSGEVAGHLYYVMPYVEGETLRARLLRERTLSLDAALKIVREAGDALEYAHAHGVIHRDVKPENILLSGGHALVADFGIARALIAEAAFTEMATTEVGLSLGTPEYMSPEQAFAEPTIDGRSDLYALGCVFYEMLSGTPPFSGIPPTAILLRKTTVDAPPLITGTPVPPHIAMAIAQALAKEAEHRFLNVGDFLHALTGPTATLRVPALEPKPKLPAVAVLPFVNLSGDPQNDYLSDGLSEELIHALAGVKGLRVMGRTTSFALKGRQGDVRAVGEELGVDALLEGSARLNGKRLRATAHLVDTHTAFELWSARYDRELVDVFEVQDEITRAIVDALKGELLPAAAPVAPAPVNGQAYERYLQARYYWNRRTTAGMKKSVAFLEEAIALDPTFAPAFATLAESHVTLAVYGSDAPELAMRAARTAAESALALQPALGEALAARGCVHALWDWDWSAAAEDFRHAIDVNPQGPTGYQWFAMHVLVPRQKFPHAFQLLDRARGLDPLSPVIAISIGLTHFFARDHAAAIAAFVELLDRDPAFGPAHAFLGQVYAEAGRHAEGLSHLGRAIELAGDSAENVAMLGVAQARAGDTAAARATLELLVRRATEGYVSPVLRAQIHAALGERERALLLLSDARAFRSTDLAWIGVRPSFDTLRGDPAFEVLLKELRLA